MDGGRLGLRSEGTAVDDAFGFAFADGERAGSHQLDFRFGEDFGAEFLGEA